MRRFDGGGTGAGTGVGAPVADTKEGGGTGAGTGVGATVAAPEEVVGTGAGRHKDGGAIVAEREEGGGTGAGTVLTTFGSTFFFLGSRLFNTFCGLGTEDFEWDPSLSKVFDWIVFWG